MIEQLVLLERPYFLLLNNCHSPYLDSVFYLFSDRYPWSIISLFFLVLMLYRQKWQECVVFLLAITLLIFIGDQLSSHIFKPFFERYRPTHHPLTSQWVQTVLEYKGGRYGFISGHSTNFISFATFTSLLLRNKLYTLIAFITALTVCYSRIYLGVHFISDVIPGIMAGLLVGYTVHFFYNTCRAIWFKRGSQNLRTPYLTPPSRVHMLSALLGGFYICIWLLGPIVFKLYV